MMPTPNEAWGYNPEQAPQLPVVPETQSRIEAFRANALETARQGLQTATEKGKEGLVNSVESGGAEKVGHRAIDIAAKTAEQSLKTLPPGTRMLGKFVGKRVISRLQDEGHARLGSALDTVAARVDATPQFPATLDAYSFSPQSEVTPTTGWGMPAAESAPQGFSIEPIPPTGGWGSAPTEITPAGFGLTPEVPVGGWGSPNEVAPLASESFWYTQPNPPAAEMPPAAKEGMLKRLRKKKDDVPAAPAPETSSLWGPTPDAPAGWGASDMQKPNESWWGN